MSHDFNELLKSAFPEKTWGRLVRAQQEGISLADDMRRSIPMLDNDLGRDLRGHFRRLGVMFRLKQLCQLGELPFQAAIDQMPDGSWHWLNLRSGMFIAHIARTDTFGEIPEDTRNRQHYLAKNQPDLFEDPKIVPIGDLSRRVDKFYAYLTFGAGRDGSMTHSALGMASSDNKDWLGLLDLRRGRSGSASKGATGPSDLSPKLDPKDRLKFRDHIQEFLRSDRDRKHEEQD